MSRATLKAFTRGTRCLRIGDIIYLPTFWRDPMSDALITTWLNWLDNDPWVEKLLGKHGAAKYDAAGRLAWMQERCIDYYSEHGRLPHWAHRMPRDLQVWCTHRGLMDRIDPLQFRGMVPFTGITFVVEEMTRRGQTFTIQLIKELQLNRLFHIRQLAYLVNGAVTEGESNGHPQDSHLHPRLQHSVEVAAIAQMIGYRIGLDRKLLRELFCAGATHDKFTPAGGDMTKIVDAAAFDEDSHYERLFRDVRWETLRRKYRLRNRTLREAVAGRGLAGSIQDLADKLSYVALDARYYLRYCRPPSNGPAENLVIDKQIRKLLEEHPLVCGIWDCTYRAVYRGEERLVVGDPERLYTFLLLRALLIRGCTTIPRAASSST